MGFFDFFQTKNNDIDLNDNKVEFNSDSLQEAKDDNLLKDLSSDNSHQDKNKSLPIAKNTNLGELAATYPHLAEVLAEDYGLHCVGCFAASFDTVEMGAQVHGMTEQEIDDMIKRLKRKHKQFLNQNS